MTAPVTFVGGPLDGRTSKTCDADTVNAPVLDYSVALRSVWTGNDRWGPTYSTVHADTIPGDAVTASGPFGMAIYKWTDPTHMQWTGTTWRCSDPECERCPITQEP